VSTRRRAIWRWTAAAVIGGAAVATVAVLPPATGPAVGVPVATDVPVAYHVHTTRSDGTGTRDQIARAAARAGAAVVIVTDHGDARRAADPPAYLDGVLVIDAVEVSSWGGHYVAIGAAPAPYPLGGEPRAVVDDVRRLGGFGVVAHPGSARDALRWRDWDGRFDGIEWLNADSEWRDRPPQLWRTVLAYPWRRVEALTALIDRPAFELQQWDQLAARRAVVGLAAHDAHARVGAGGVGEPYDGWVALTAPAYDALFASFVNVARVPSALTGEPAVDAAMVLGALRAGRVYSVLTGIARPGQVRFSAASDGRRAAMGEHLIPRGPVSVAFEADVPASAHTDLRCDGRVVAESDGGRVTWAAEGVPGACRVEVRLRWAGAERLWLATNPIYIRAQLDAAPPLEQLPVVATAPVPAPAAAWSVERADDATAAVTAAASGAAADFSWRLGPAAQTFAAMQLAAPAALAAFDSLVLTAHADRPMRVWLQLRVPGGDGQRWGRSIYLDPETQVLRVPFDAMLPLGAVEQSRPPLASVTAVLIVVDTVHAEAGSGGRVTVESLVLAR
jgi:hypothetical protein